MLCSWIGCMKLLICFLLVAYLDLLIQSQDMILFFFCAQLLSLNILNSLINDWGSIMVMFCLFPLYTSPFSILHANKRIVLLGWSCFCILGLTWSCFTSYNFLLHAFLTCWCDDLAHPVSDFFALIFLPLDSPCK